MKVKAYIRLFLNKLKRGLRLLLYKRWVRTSIYKLQHFSLPGFRGAPIYDVLRYFLVGLFDGSISQCAKGLAFSFLTALPPLMIFFFSLVAYFPVDGVQDELLANLSDIVPEKVMGPLSDTVNDIMGHRHSTLLSIGFIVSILFAANGIMGVITSINFVNRDNEKRPLLQRYLLSVALVFVLYIMVILTISLMMGNKWLLQYIYSRGWLTETRFNTLLFHIVRWLLITFSILVTISFIYYWAPVKRRRVGFFSPGALLSMGMFLVLNWGLGVYFNHFNNYNLVYGSIGTLLILMLWMYLNCAVLLVGYKLNNSVYDGLITAENRRSRRELRQKFQIIYKTEN
ncbi:MAG: YihY/virulence factor BrkB family protein [Bacteroidales bacterium]|nr:YihY/virulence factor BrkB family protein [Bacteroidales bacterium]